MALGDYLRERRLELGLTQKELARRSGDSINDQYISDWENRRGMPSPAHYVLLIAALELNPWDAWRQWVEAKVPGYELPELTVEELNPEALRSQAADPARAEEAAREMGRRGNPPADGEAPRQGPRRVRRR